MMALWTTMIYRPARAIVGGVVIAALLWVGAYGLIVLGRLVAG